LHNLDSFVLSQIIGVVVIVVINVFVVVIVAVVVVVGLADVPPLAGAAHLPPADHPGRVAMHFEASTAAFSRKVKFCSAWFSIHLLHISSK
jgi:hypothetical protein